MNYYLRTYDNYHFRNESEAFNEGNFETYEEALAAAKIIVDDFLLQNSEKGMKPENLLFQWMMFGEAPEILPKGKSGIEHFSAGSYAKMRSEEIMPKHKSNQE